MKTTERSLFFMMRLCHVRLPIYEKSGDARSLGVRPYPTECHEGKKQEKIFFRWQGLTPQIKLCLYEKKQKTRPDPIEYITPHDLAALSW